MIQKLLAVNTEYNLANDHQQIVNNTNHINQLNFPKIVDNLNLTLFVYLIFVIVFQKKKEGKYIVILLIQINLIG